MHDVAVTMIITRDNVQDQPVNPLSCLFMLVHVCVCVCD